MKTFTIYYEGVMIRRVQGYGIGSYENKIMIHDKEKWPITLIPENYLIIEE